MSRRLPPIRNVALVAAGGAAGTLARVALATWFPVAEGAWPWTTFLENVSGAFALAFVLTLLAEQVSTDPAVRLLVCTGALGSFTTYSTLAAELDRLGRGDPELAVLYGAGSLLAGIVAALAGLRAGRARPPRRPARGTPGAAP